MKFTSTLVTGGRLFVLSAMLTLIPPAYAANEALLELFKILRDKGSLSQNEYDILMNAAKAEEEKTEFANLQARQKSEEKLATVDEKTGKIKWTEKIKLKGDVRTRYQYDDRDGSLERNRGRLRYRLGIIAKPADGWEVGAGLVSGGSDPRSTNQTFDNTFSTKGINLDYAYMQYRFANGFKAIAGKFRRKKYLWAPTDVMWDGDINPEGFSVNYETMNAWGGLFANTGVWILEQESSSARDPYMTYGQLGQSWNSGDWFGTLAGTIYSFSNIDFISDITRTVGTNTGSNLGSFNLALEFGTKIGGGRAKLLGEYIDNYETDSGEDLAWAAGAKYDYDKWGLKYVYADIETDSVPDFLPDSDRFGGWTGIRGHEIALSYALMKNVKLGLDFYSVETISGDVDEELLQADLNVNL